MLERVLQFSIERRFFVVLVVAALAGFGLYSFQRLPIDAVPDITNNQVQVNTVFAGFSPVEIEQQITFPVETALAGIPGLVSTRSLSRNGFSQVTAIFRDDVNIYFARQQVNERLSAARESFPPGAEPTMGAISTGLGEVYMWTVEYAPRPHSAPSASGTVRGTCLRSFGLSCPCQSKPCTSAAIFTGESETSNASIRRTPLSPLRSPFQKASRPMPMGVTHPMPVMTTRRGCLKRLSMADSLY